MNYDLFPPIEPFASGFLPVDDLHTLYWERVGNPDGQPIVFLHGGPGGGISSNHRRFFDPKKFSVLLFDQRGAGRSRPNAETRANTTDHLIADIETLRRQFHIGKWHVFGGSWGSTLALAYAEAHPESVLSLTLRGIFLMRESELKWFLYDARQVFPDAWDAFAGFIPEIERGDLLAAYMRRFANPDPKVHMPAALAWYSYEVTCSTLMPSVVAADKGQEHVRGIATLEAHYFRNNRFSPDDKLLRDVHKIRHIPATIVQGRYDMVCPAVSAFELAAAWPEATFKVIPDAGHSVMEPGIRSALIEALAAL